MMTRSEILTNVFTQLRNAGFVYNKSDFACHLKYEPSYLSAHFSGNRPISDKTFYRILKVFPQVNRAYLFSGEGAILNASGPRKQPALVPLRSSTGDHLLETLMAERSDLQKRLERIDQALSLLCPRELKSAS